MEEHQHLPDASRLSSITAMILLAYAATPYIQIPAPTIAFQLPGFYFSSQVKFGSILSILVAGLAAVGVDWLIRDHPHHENRALFQHGFIPALTAIVIGVPLTSLEPSPQWWAILALGVSLLVLVFIAEYIVVDAEDIRYAPATLGLTAISYALFLFLTIALKGAGFRLFVLLPLVMVVVGFFSLRTLYLQLGGRWSLAWSVGIALIMGQFVVGLHYFALSPIKYGLFLLAPLYALNNIASSIEEGKNIKQFWLEPAIMTAVILIFGMVIKG